MKTNELIVCTGLTKYYAGLCALNDVNLTIGRGRIVGLLGPNGSGKSTIIKLMNGLLTPSKGEVRIDGEIPGVYTHSIVSYLPERTYLNQWMKTCDVIDFFADFYKDFDKNKAYQMLHSLNISPKDLFKTMSKGTKEKIQLILVMSRAAQLYLLDEPIGGVDPAARDYILNTVLKNYSENSTVLVSTHLISNIERVLDEVVFLRNGKIALHETVDNIRQKNGKSVDALFREEFAC